METTGIHAWCFFSKNDAFGSPRSRDKIHVVLLMIRMISKTAETPIVAAIRLLGQSDAAQIRSL